MKEQHYQRITLVSTTESLSQVVFLLFGQVQRSAGWSGPADMDPGRHPLRAWRLGLVGRFCLPRSSRELSGRSETGQFFFTVMNSCNGANDPTNWDLVGGYVLPRSIIRSVWAAFNEQSKSIVRTFEYSWSITDSFAKISFVKKSSTPQLTFFSFRDDILYTLWNQLPG